MKLTIQKNSAFSLQSQLKQQIKFAVLTSKLSSGNRLPTVRDLANQLKINRNTVFTVYKELEREGFVQCEQGRGVFIKKQRDSKGTKRLIELLSILEDALAKAKSHGITADEFVMAALFKAQTSYKTYTELSDDTVYSMSPSDLILPIIGIVK